MIHFAKFISRVLSGMRGVFGTAAKWRATAKTTLAQTRGVVAGAVVAAPALLMLAAFLTPGAALAQAAKEGEGVGIPEDCGLTAAEATYVGGHYSIALGCRAAAEANEIVIGRQDHGPNNQSWGNIRIGDVNLTDAGDVDDRIDVTEGTNAGTVTNARTGNNAQRTNWAVDAIGTISNIDESIDQSQPGSGPANDSNLVLALNESIQDSEKANENLRDQLGVGGGCVNGQASSPDAECTDEDDERFDNSVGTTPGDGNLAQRINFVLQQIGNSDENLRNLSDGDGLLDGLDRSLSAGGTTADGSLVDAINGVIDDSEWADGSIRRQLGIGEPCTGMKIEDRHADCMNFNDGNIDQDVDTEGNLAERINYVLQQIGGRDENLRTLNDGLLDNLDDSVTDSNLVAALDAAIQDSEQANRDLRGQLGVGTGCSETHGDRDGNRNVHCTGDGDGQFATANDPDGNLVERINVILQNVIGTGESVHSLNRGDTITIHSTIANNNHLVEALTETVVDSLARDGVIQDRIGMDGTGTYTVALPQDSDGNTPTRAAGSIANAEVIAQLDALRRTLGISATSTYDSMTGQLRNENGALAQDTLSRALTTLGIDANGGISDAVLGSGRVGDGSLASHVNLNAQNISGLDARIQQNQATTQMLSERLDAQNSELSAGIAMAAALGAAPALLPGKTLALDLGLGGYNGQNAIAVGLNGRLNEYTLVNAGAAVGTSDASSKTAYRVGLSWQW